MMPSFQFHCFVRLPLDAPARKLAVPVKRRFQCLRFSFLLIGGMVSSWGLAEEPVDFNRDVRPILSKNCFACHGFDENSRATDLRLDTRDGAVEDLGGYAAIVPGSPEESDLISRVTDTDPDSLMPPADSHKKPLSEDEVSVLRRWISQDAPWGKHWSFQPPIATARDGNATHPVDHFVAKRLKAKGLHLAARAKTHTLARRLAFDLTGLPPAAEEVATLGGKPSDAQWEQWIDRLIASPQFGERMAMWWLDGARFCDSDGFQQDETRTNWPWRDWVVDSLNDNMPFDQFTIEQFAGDLLPDATEEQKLATCFHRNHMHNGEGGRDPEESRVDYVLDRTNTVGTQWLGLTLGCTQCHDHKFDPISQNDYYSLSAFFNSIDEDGKAGGDAGPFLNYRSPHAGPAVLEAEQLVEQTKVKRTNIKAAMQEDFLVAAEEMIGRAKTFQPWLPVDPAKLQSVEGTELVLEKDAIVRAGDQGKDQDDYRITVAPIDLQRITGMQLEVFSDPAHADAKYSYTKSGEFVLTNVKLQVRATADTGVRDIELVRATASVDGEGEDSKYGDSDGTLDDDPRTGWTTRTKPVEPMQKVVFELQEPLVLAKGELLEIVLMQRSLAPQELIGRFRLSLTDQRGAAVQSLDPMPMERLAEAILAKDETAKDRPAESDAFTIADLDESLRESLLDQFLEDDALWIKASHRNSLAQDQLKQAQEATQDQRVTVLTERESPRSTYILVRGVWDAKGDDVSPGVLPAVLPRDADKVPTRLELAKWLVDRENPLTARVITNQVWQLFFGAGLVRTPSDFGMQGESPTHPELLDWLAVDFMESGWDLKHLVRQIVTSQTYQQDSSVTPELIEQDPENRLLARGARFRLPSWMIRDTYLHYSGLINPTIGGPPVFPYQPPGVWYDQFMGRFTYTPSIGPAQYRRTLYAFWRRTSAPTFLFDNAMRRTCDVTPHLTNTPLQALTLLNDITSLEAARTLAQNAIESDANPSQHLPQLFRTVLCRQASSQEHDVLMHQHASARKYYDAHTDEAIELTTVGQLAAPDPDDAATLAATMLIVNMILNLDESITHE